MSSVARLIRIAPLLLSSSLALVCFPAGAQTTKKASAKKISFARDVAPILAEKCMQCHGREPLMANLDLRTRDGALKGAQHGPVVVPGDAAVSHLYRRLLGQEQPQMPLGGRLTDPEIETLRAWIDSGAEWDPGTVLGNAVVSSAPVKKFTEQQKKYWAFQKVVKPATPPVKDKAWIRSPIDSFILSKLESKNLKPNGPADKITLLRRHCGSHRSATHT